MSLRILASPAVSALLLFAFGHLNVACQNESRAAEAPPSVHHDAPSPSSAPSAPSVSAAASVAHQATETGAQHPVVTVSTPGRVGYTAALGSTQFRIWGAAEAGPMPKALVNSRDGERLFASNMGVDGERTLSVYSSNPLKLERHLDVPGKAIELAMSMDDDVLFVSNSKEWGKVQVFDSLSLELLREVAVPGFPKWMLPHPDGASLFVALWALDGVSRLNLANDEVDTLRTTRGRYSRHERRDKNPRGMALSADGVTLIVANNADETLSLIDAATLAERSRVRVGYAPRHVVASKSGTVFVSLTGNDSVLEFDPRTERAVREVSVGARPKTIALSADERFLYTGNFVDNSVSVVELATGKRLDVALNLHKVSGLSVRPDDRFVYVTGFCTHDVWAIERIDEGTAPTRPLGPDRINEPCLDCASSFVGCPYYGGPTQVREQATPSDSN